MTQGVLFQPTEEQRRIVKGMAGLGVPHEGIAVILEIDPKTLRKYFPQDLERGSVEATAKVAQSLFQMATSGQSVAAAIFWMKARAGWREKHEVQIAPSSDLSRLTDEQLEQMLTHYEEEIRLARNSEPPLIDGAVDTPAF